MKNEEFRKILQNERKKQGISQSKLAEMTGFTKRAIQYWENGKRSIMLEHANTIANALNISFVIGRE